jgi:hypothetical protein
MAAPKTSQPLQQPASKSAMKKSSTDEAIARLTAKEEIFKPARATLKLEVRIDAAELEYASAKELTRSGHVVPSAFASPSA